MSSPANAAAKNAAAKNAASIRATVGNAQQRQNQVAPHRTNASRNLNGKATKLVGNWVLTLPKENRNTLTNYATRHPSKVNAVNGANGPIHPTGPNTQPPVVVEENVNAAAPSNSAANATAAPPVLSGNPNASLANELRRNRANRKSRRSNHSNRNRSRKNRR